MIMIGRPPNHSGLMLASSATLRQRAISFATNRVSWSRDITLGSAPSAAKRCFSSVDCNALVSSLARRLTMSAGVFAGAARPYQNSAK